MKPNNTVTQVFGFLLMSVILLTATEIAEAQMKSELVETKPDIVQYILKGDSESLSIALSNGVDVNQQTRVGNTFLMAAAKIGDRKTVEALLNHDADVNLRNKAGATALMIAAKYDNPGVVTLLLDHGADPTIENNNGYTASNFAWGYKRTEIYDQLKLAEIDFVNKKKYAGHE